MGLDLRSVFSPEPGQTDALESFLCHRLFEANVWQSPRTSDGIKQLRVVDFEPGRVCVWGRIFEIDQTLHSFCLVLTRSASENSIVWALYFDVVADSPHQRDALDAYDRSEGLAWRVGLTGAAEVRDGSLVVPPTK